MVESVSRRRFLGVVSSAGLVSIAGCGGDGGDPSGSDKNESDEKSGNGGAEPTETEAPAEGSELFDSVEVVEEENDSEVHEFEIIAEVNTDASVHGDVDDYRWVDGDGEKYRPDTDSTEEQLVFSIAKDYAPGTQKVRARNLNEETVAEATFEYTPEIDVVEMSQYKDASEQPHEVSSEFGEFSDGVLTVENTGSGFTRIESVKSDVFEGVTFDWGEEEVDLIREKGYNRSNKILPDEEIAYSAGRISANEMEDLSCGADQTIEGEMTVVYSQGEATFPLTITLGGERESIEDISGNEHHTCTELQFDVGDRS